jgi:hypothetical protein
MEEVEKLTWRDSGSGQSYGKYDHARTEGENDLGSQAAAAVETVLPSIPQNARLSAGQVTRFCVARS